MYHSEEFIHYAFPQPWEKETTQGRAMGGPPYRFFQQREPGNRYREQPSDIRGTRFECISITAALSLGHKEYLYRFIEWMQSLQGNIMIGGLRRSEPKGFRLITRYADGVHFSLHARCADDLVEAAEALRDFVPIADEEYRRERLRK